MEKASWDPRQLSLPILLLNLVAHVNLSSDIAATSQLPCITYHLTHPNLTHVSEVPLRQQCMQIVLLNLVVHAHINLSSDITATYQIVRILRLLRFFSLLRRLYATAIATSAFVLPGLSVGPHSRIDIEIKLVLI